jgi:hypothetical protein
MFTSIDKALVALIMSAIFLVNFFFGLNLGFLTQETVATVVGLLTPILVWATPNKSA